MGTFRQTMDAGELTQYLDDVREDLALYSENELFIPAGCCALAIGHSQ